MSAPIPTKTRPESTNIFFSSSCCAPSVDMVNDVRARTIENVLHGADVGDGKVGVGGPHGSLNLF